MRSNHSRPSSTYPSKAGNEKLKKAISVAETWLKKNGGSVSTTHVSYGSGRSVEDLYNAVLDEMFLILSCDLDDTIAEDSNEEDANITSKRSSDWFFLDFFCSLYSQDSQ